MRSDRLALAALAGLAVLLVVAGLVTVGGPEEARRQRRDEARVAALSDLARCMAQLPVAEFDTLPPEMAADTPCVDRDNWRDAGTGAPFRLVRGEGGAFSLCAAFENPASVRRNFYGQSFDPATGCVTARRDE
jgi:hypothetical protein